MTIICKRCGKTCSSEKYSDAFQSGWEHHSIINNDTNNTYWICNECREKNLLNVEQKVVLHRLRQILKKYPVSIYVKDKNDKETLSVFITKHENNVNINLLGQSCEPTGICQVTFQLDNLAENWDSTFEMYLVMKMYELGIIKECD